jgi:hypothetical protein
MVSITVIATRFYRSGARSQLCLPFSIGSSAHRPPYGGEYFASTLRKLAIRIGTIHFSRRFPRRGVCAASIRRVHFNDARQWRWLRIKFAAFSPPLGEKTKPVALREKTKPIAQ